MTARLDGEQKGGNPLLPDTQGGGLHYDRSHRKLTKDGFESAAHLTAYAQKSIVVVVGKRRLPSGYGISREAGGDHEVAVYLFRLGSTPGCRLVDIAVCSLKVGTASTVRTTSLDMEVLSSSTTPTGMFSICPFPKIVDMKKIQNSGSTTHTPKSTKQTGSYDLRTFEVHALPVRKVEGLRPGMSVLVELTMDN